MIKLNKSDFNSKQEIESQLSNYKKWYNGELKGIPEPVVKKEIKQIVKGEDWEFINKTKEEIKKEDLLEKEIEIEEKYKNNIDLWISEVIRPEKNRRLYETDSPYFRPDYPISVEQKNELLQYSQELRDFTDTLTEYTESVQWPIKPSFMQ
jgi:hypothetical protein